MAITWINERYPEGNRIFDSEREAEEWADSLFDDFAGGIAVNVGYATPDKKVFSFLSKFLSDWVNYNNAQVIIHSETEYVGGNPLYKIWVTAQAQ